MPTPAPRPWPAICREHLREAGGDPAIASALLAFEGALEQRASTFRELDEQAQSVASLVERVATELAGEVDAAQAQMFARRLEAVHSLLSGQASAVSARVLRVGLTQRVTEILGAPAPRALRVRAAVDFYYSQGALLRHGRGGPRLEALLEGVRWRDLGRGLSHAILEGPSEFGPLRANLLRVAGGRVETAAPVGGARLDELVAEAGADAGVSGGFFLYSEPDIALPARRGDPVGLLVRGGEVLNPPALRRAALVHGPEGTRVEVRGPVGMGVRWAAGGAEVVGCNTAGPGLRLFNRAYGDHGPPGLRSAAMVGCEVLAVGAGPLPIPLSGFVLTGVPDGIQAGDSLAYSLPNAPSAAMAGGPMLLAPEGPIRELVAEDFAHTAPPITFSADETYDQNLLPRMAAGVNAAGELLFAAVDGRNIERALGVTLSGLARLMAGLGCTHALNLDGGSSKRMVVEGRVVDLTSTEVVSGPGGGARVRPVRSALLIYGDAGRQT